MSHAVVIVSGGDALSPFTTPDLACSTGLAAGNTGTYLRERLLAAGHQAFTAPAMNTRGPVLDAEPGSFGAFGGQPQVLPAHMTIWSTADIDLAGEHLTRFMTYLHQTEGVDSVSWVGHSNGGLYATAASAIMRATGHPVAVVSLVTLGTPWCGTVPIQVGVGELDESVLMGDERALAILAGGRSAAARDKGLIREDTRAYLLGERGWGASQIGGLDGVPTLLIAGGYLEHEGGHEWVWPFDGLVSEYSALAVDVPAGLIPDRRTASFPLLHSIFFADLAGLPWETGLTWNPQVAELVVEHLA